MTTILFVCVHNAGRSVMAEAFFNASAPPGARAISAGTAPPGGEPHPAVVAVMAEEGLDVSGHRARALTDEMVAGAARVITMGCAVDADACPAIRYADVEDWALPDPRDRPVEEVRAIREEVRAHVAALIAELTSVG